jgi:two-component system chemotaxis response regulator CheB
VAERPAALPAAVIVLQHLEPDRASELAAILDHRTALPVELAVDGDRLAPARVWGCARPDSAP